MLARCPVHGMVRASTHRPGLTMRTVAGEVTAVGTGPATTLLPVGAGRSPVVAVPVLVVSVPVLLGSVLAGIAGQLLVLLALLALLGIAWFAVTFRLLAPSVSC